MSHSLRQLRELLDDPLLVRHGHTMTPTPRAEALAPLLDRGLTALDEALRNPDEPSPSSFTERFTLAVQDLPAAIFLPRLFQRIQAEAPRASLAVVAPSPTLSEELMRGDVHVAMFPPIAPPKGLLTREFPSRPDTGWVVAGRADHPALQSGELDLDGYCGLPHIMMSVTGSGGSWVDAFLAQMGRERRVALRLPYGLAAPGALMTSDAVITLPELAFNHFASIWPLCSATVPFDGPSPRQMFLGWHERYDADPAHCWFRELVLDVAVHT